MDNEQAIFNYLSDKGEMFVTDMSISGMPRSSLNARLSIMAKSGKIERRLEWNEVICKQCWLYIPPKAERVYKTSNPFRGEPEYAYILRNFSRLPLQEERHETR